MTGAPLQALHPQRQSAFHPPTINSEREPGFVSHRFSLSAVLARWTQVNVQALQETPLLNRHTGTPELEPLGSGEDGHVSPLSRWQRHILCRAEKRIASYASKH